MLLVYFRSLFALANYHIIKLFAANSTLGHSLSELFNTQLTIAINLTWAFVCVHLKSVTII